MDVSTAVRRGSVRLKSLGGSYTNLNLIVSQLRDVKHTFQAYINAQNIAAQDMLKWAHNSENRATNDVCMHYADLFTVWTSVQMEFVECFRVFRKNFEVILEGEKRLVKAREKLEGCEQKRIKAKKELRKTAKKASDMEVAALKQRLEETETATTVAHGEVVEISKENEAVKLIRLKQGLTKISDGYIELGKKCQILFEGQREIASHLPSVPDQNIHLIRYDGFTRTAEIALRTKERIQQAHLRPSVVYDASAPENTGPPPPYRIQTRDLCSPRSCSGYASFTRDDSALFESSNVPEIVTSTPTQQAATSPTQPVNGYVESCDVCPSNNCNITQRLSPITRYENVD